MSRLVLLAVLILLAVRAEAHKSSDSYLWLDANGARVTGRWDIALRDLEAAVGIDADGDDSITAGELAAARPRIARYALSRLALETGAGACPAKAGGQSLARRSDGAYASIAFGADCSGPALDLSVRYTLLFDIDRLHRGVARIAHDGRVETAIFTPERPLHRVRSGPLETASAFFLEGVWHIWIGIDHVLFVLTLLLPALFCRGEGAWRARPSGRDALLPVVKLLTAFTLAHSITLGLATTGLVLLPSAPVEAAIAATVVLAALNNIRPVVTRRKWVLAFGFGLVHGFGFASVLGALGLPGGSMAVALLAFNLGVEAGQIAIVLAALPLLWLLRGWPAYPRFALPAGSAAIALVAAVWFVERAFAV